MKNNNHTIRLKRIKNKKYAENEYYLLVVRFENGEIEEMGVAQCMGDGELECADLSDNAFFSCNEIYKIVEIKK